MITRKSLLIGGAMMLALAMASAATAQSVEWPTYTGDLAGSRYRPLDQINASNFSKLEVAWRFKTDNIGNRPEFKLAGTPLMVGGVVYATAGSRRGVVALDAATGELLWVYSLKEGARGAAAARQLSGRGLSYWSDGKEARIFYVTTGYRLVALDAKTGRPVPGFGTDGMVDLKTDFDQQMDLVTGEAGLHATPTVSGNTILVGTAFREGFTPAVKANSVGYVRAFDARTGKRIWTFHTIPKKGEYGYDTWLKGSAEQTGNTAVWTQMTVDEATNTAFLAVESPTSDFYGGHRPGNGLFGNSLVAVDLSTGVRKWHFQIIHHEIWDYDNSSAPLLMDINVEGKPIKAVALPSKQGLLYVFDRNTGKPVWPIPEVKVPKGDVPGEWYAPTQPIPSKPPAYARNGIGVDDLIDFTPELRAKAVELTKNYKMGPIYTPPVVSKLPGPLGLLSYSAQGGTNWPGGSFDPETGIAYIFACNSCIGAYGLQPPPAGMSDLDYVVGVAGQPVTMIRTPGEGSGADAPRPPTPPAGGGGTGRLTVDGLPLLKPPYSTISAIDLSTGTIKWQIAHGETPDFIRNNPALKGLNIPRTGQSGYQIGTLVTKSLVIAGDGLVTTTPEHPRGAMLRAYDKTNGKEVGAVFMPAPQSGSPMTYSLNGKQYLIVAVSGGAYSGEYIAYTLPTSK